MSYKLPIPFAYFFLDFCLSAFLFSYKLGRRLKSLVEDNECLGRTMWLDTAVLDIGQSVQDSPQDCNLCSAYCMYSSMRNSCMHPPFDRRVAAIPQRFLCKQHELDGAPTLAKFYIFYGGYRSSRFSPSTPRAPQGLGKLVELMAC